MRGIDYKKINELIKGNIEQGNSVAIIGCSDVGKTWYVIKELIPFLKENAFECRYFKNPKEIDVQGIKTKEIVILDEVETLFDKSRLEEKYLSEEPYYSDEYLLRVKHDFEIFRNIKNQCIYIISRNDEEDVGYLVRNFKKTDWDNRKIQTIFFK